MRKCKYCRLAKEVSGNKRQLCRACFRTKTRKEEARKERIEKK